MSGRRKPGSASTSATDGFNVRWHAIATSYTPRADIMSSPDPLNDDSIALVAPPSSQRTTRSTRSGRLTPRPSSSRAGSPRKQQFELEVGDNKSPQRLLVTVETEEGEAPPSTSTRRKLFSSPSPFPAARPRVSATTTRVPLKESIEDEFGEGPYDGESTPKRRGRPRKTNGTPIPGAKKRRAGTPIRRTPKRPNTAQDVDPISDYGFRRTPTPTPRRSRTPQLISLVDPDESEDVFLSDPIAQTTPTPKRQSRPSMIPSVEVSNDNGIASPSKPAPTPSPRKRRRSQQTQSAEPSSEAGVRSTTRTGSIRTGRKRRQALAPEDLQEMVEGQPEPIQEEQPEYIPEEQPELVPADDNEVDLVGTSGDAEQPEQQYAEPSPPPDNGGSDIWIATASDQATPRATSSNRRASIPAPAPMEQHSSPAPVDNLPSEAEGFGDEAESFGGDSPVLEERNVNMTRRNDTVAQEDFSMIFMDSIPSFQEFKSSMQGHPGADNIPTSDGYGEETSRIINETLESLRHDNEQEEPEPQVQESAAHGQVEDDMDVVQRFEAEAEFEPKSTEIAEAEEDEFEGVIDFGDQEPEEPEEPQAESESQEPIAEAEEDAFEGIAQAGADDFEEPQEEEGRQQEMAFEAEQDEVEDAADYGGDGYEESEVQPQDTQAEEDELAGVDDSEDAGFGEPEEEPGMELEMQQEEDDEAMEVEDEVAEVVQAQSQAERQRAPGPAVELMSSSPVRQPPEIRQTESGSSAFRAAPQVKRLSSLSLGQMFSPKLVRSPHKMNISPLRRRVLDSATKNADATPRASERGSPSKRPSLRPGEEDSNLYEDSFSEIPEAVLEAATPRRPAVAPVAEPEEEDDPEEVNDLDEMEFFQEEPEPEEDFTEEPAALPASSSHQALPDATEQAAPVQSSPAVQLERGRLPTPDDTPPNIEVEADESPEKSVHQASSPAAGPDAQLTSEHDAAPSSPPRSHFLQLPEQHNRSRPSAERGSSALEITPVNQMSSPAQEPQSGAAEPTPDKASRPALSAIVRAGRVLQSVTSDPPSPRDRQNSLGSPFRSSASKESGGSRDAAAGLRVSASPGRRPVSFHRRSISNDKIGDDPFAPGSSSRAAGSNIFSQALEKTTQKPTEELRQKFNVSSAGSAASSMRITPPDDEMSWVANEDPISPNLRGDNTLREIAERSTSGATRSASQVRIEEPEEPDEPEQESEPEEVEPEAEPEAEEEPTRRVDDETDIWDIEASRPEPQSTRRQQSFGQSQRTSAPLHRRSALPSPWTKKANPVVPNLRASQRSTATAADASKGQQEGDAEEYSLLEQRQKAHEAEAAKAADSANKSNKFDLSSFFSSPAAIPGKLAERFFSSKPNSSALEGSSMLAPVPTNSMFPSLSWKASAPTPQEESRTDLHSSVQPKETPTQARQDAQGDQGGSASPDTPERLEMPVSAQRRDFTPRPRQTNQSFARQPAPEPAVAPTPPRMQLSHADIHRWQQETTRASDGSDSPPRRFLRPLPPKNASPPKSSMRSPLKPHTPGRVVEFTSSVLSPVEQAVQRHQRRMSNAELFESEPENYGQPEPLQAPQQTLDDEENQDSDVSMSDASPLLNKAAQQEEAPMLSQTKWSRQHWLFMDKLIQYRRETPFTLEGDRRSKKYLGKKIKSHGESLVLEQWHLDCVDAFKEVVGGWDEGILAKRLFALLKGEEKRQRRSAERTTQEIMFH